MKIKGEVVCFVFLLLLFGTIPESRADLHTTTLDPAIYNGAGGTITFDDWGFTGPGGRGYNDFAPINGFGGLAEGNALDPTGGIGQMQHVITVARDRKTPDAPYTIRNDAMPSPSSTYYPNANMDATVNFYQYGYTTRPGSTFGDASAIDWTHTLSNKKMLIDYDGDYFVPRTAMNFLRFKTFEYQDMVDDPDGTDITTIDTNLQFKPVVLSDAKGWCGSVLASHPAALEAMAGQLQFDVAFNVFYPWGASSQEIIPNFHMGSYGTIDMNIVLGDGSTLNYHADAVVNNTNPLSGNKTVSPSTPVDPDYYNLVSFMGGDLVPYGVWMNPDGTVYRDAAGNVYYDPDVAPSDPNAIWHKNMFGGYPFLLRADGQRTVDWFDASVYGPYPPVPEPGTLVLLGSGMVGLLCLKKRIK